MDGYTNIIRFIIIIFITPNKNRYTIDETHGEMSYYALVARAFEGIKVICEDKDQANPESMKADKEDLEDLEELGHLDDLVTHFCRVMRDASANVETRYQCALAIAAMFRSDGGPLLFNLLVQNRALLGIAALVRLRCKGVDVREGKDGYGAKPLLLFWQRFFERAKTYECKGLASMILKSGFVHALSVWTRHISDKGRLACAYLGL